MNPEAPQEPEEDEQPDKQEERRKKKWRSSSFLAELFKRERSKEAEVESSSDKEKLKSLDERTRSEFFMEVAERFRRAGNRFLSAVRGGESVEQNQEASPEGPSEPEENSGSQGGEVVDETSVLTRLQRLRLRLAEQFKTTPEPESAQREPGPEVLAPERSRGNGSPEANPTYQRTVAAVESVSLQADVIDIEERRRALKEGQRQGLILGLVAGGLTVGLYQRHKRKRLEKKLNKQLIEKQHELEEKTLKTTAEKRALMRKQRELERKLAAGQKQEVKIQKQAKMKERPPRRPQLEKSVKQSRNIEPEPQIEVIEVQPEDVKTAALPIAEVGVVAVAIEAQQTRVIKPEVEAPSQVEIASNESEAMVEQLLSRTDVVRPEPREVVEELEQLKTPVAAPSTQEVESSIKESMRGAPEASSAPVAVPETLAAKSTKARPAKTAQPQSLSGASGGVQTAKPVFAKDRQEPTSLADSLLDTPAEPRSSRGKTAIATLLTVVAFFILFLIFS